MTIYNIENKNNHLKNKRETKNIKIQNTKYLE